MLLPTEARNKQGTLWVVGDYPGLDWRQESAQSDIVDISERIKSGGGGAGLAILLAVLPTLGWTPPLWLRLFTAVVAAGMLVHAFLPARIGRMRMTFGLTLAAVGALALAVGVLWHFFIDAYHPTNPAAEAQTIHIFKGTPAPGGMTTTINPALPLHVVHVGAPEASKPPRAGPVSVTPGVLSRSASHRHVAPPPTTPAAAASAAPAQALPRLSRQLIVTRRSLETTMNGRDAAINGFHLGVKNIGTEPLKYRVDFLYIYIDGKKDARITSPTEYWPATQTLFMEGSFRFAPPIPVARPAKEIVVEMQISYDDDPPLGVRTMYEKIQYPISWFDTQHALFNTENVLEHTEK